MYIWLKYTNKTHIFYELIYNSLVYHMQYDTNSFIFLGGKMFERKQKSAIHSHTQKTDNSVIV